jgi:hypothetical protein
VLLVNPANKNFSTPILPTQPHPIPLVKKTRVPRSHVAAVAAGVPTAAGVPNPSSVASATVKPLLRPSIDTRVYSDYRTGETWLLWNRIDAEYFSRMTLKIISPYSFGIRRPVTRINVCVIPFLPSPALSSSSTPAHHHEP